MAMVTYPSSAGTAIPAGGSPPWPWRERGRVGSNESPVPPFLFLPSSIPTPAPLLETLAATTGRHRCSPRGRAEPEERGPPPPSSGCPSSSASLMRAAGTHEDPPRGQAEPDERNPLPPSSGCPSSSVSLQRARTKIWTSAGASSTGSSTSILHSWTSETEMEMEEMRNCYDSLLSAATGTTSSDMSLQKRWKKWKHAYLRKLQLITVMRTVGYKEDERLYLASDSEQLYDPLMLVYQAAFCAPYRTVTTRLHQLFWNRMCKEQGTSPIALGQTLKGHEKKTATSFFYENVVQLLEKVNDQYLLSYTQALLIFHGGQLFVLSAKNICSKITGRCIYVLISTWHLVDYILFRMLT